MSSGIRNEKGNLRLTRQRGSLRQNSVKQCANGRQCRKGISKRKESGET